jgi:hypothetical protein
MTNVVDKELLKRTLKELVIHEPNFVKNLITEINDDLVKTKKERLESIVDEDFAEYQKVFEALA